MPNLSDQANILVIRGAWLNPVTDERCDFFQDGILLARKGGDQWTISDLGPTSEIIKKTRVGRESDQA